MAKKLVLNEVLDTIANNTQIVFIQDIIAYSGVSESTFYRCFPADSEDRRKIDESLQHNKTLIKKGLRKKWFTSSNATTDIALYRLLATPEEIDALNSVYKVTSDEKKITLKID
jgi:hypothetical protein